MTRIVGKDWDGDPFDRILIHESLDDVDEYVEHLYCCDYKEVKVLGTKDQEIVTIHP
jgi:hypothetical protein